MELDVKGTLKNSIGKLSSEFGIAPKDFRIKISKPISSLKYEVMNKKDIVAEVPLSKALDLNAVTTFLVSAKLNDVFVSISDKYRVVEETMNIRIFTKAEDCSPSLYLFDGGTPKQELTLEEIT